MTDDGSSEREYGGFVFGNDGTADSDAESSLVDGNGESGLAVDEDGSGLTADDGSRLDEGLDARRIAAALMLSLAIIVFAVVVIQPLVTGMATDLFGAEPSSGAGNATTGMDPAATSAPAETTATTRDRRPTATTTETTTPLSSSTSVTFTETTTGAGAATPATRQAGENTTVSANTTATSSRRSPAIESFTVTDRSAGGNATFDVAWNVTDPDVDLASVRMTVVADPDGEARTVARRRFDAGGASTVDNGTFGVAGGSGGVYEIRMRVSDTEGNTVFTLVREVADGDPDG